MDSRRVLRSLISAALLTITAVISAYANDLRAGAHFDRQKLERVGNFIRNEIATGRIPGAVILIQQHGQPVYFESFGVRDVESKHPMTADTIFRIYSMSKPITSVAAMMLVEDGKLRLDDPVSKYIPDFADTKVGVEKTDEGGKPALVLEPLNRPITIEDLLRHTSGLTYGFYGENAVRKLYANSDIYGGDFDNATFAERIARLPLAEKQRLLDPLGMSETAFFVADAAQRPRIAEPMPDDRFTPVAGIRDSTLPRRWESGGAGMVGTIGDYARFAQMLLNGGTLDGKRYLKAETIASMASDHIGPETKIAHEPFYFPGDTSGFGLGFAVRTVEPANTSWPLGEYRWDGAAGTSFFVDPRDDMFAICMVQAPSQGGRIQFELKTLIYEAFNR